VRVALAQLDPRLGLVDENAAAAAVLVDQAVEAGAELIVFPECALTGYAVWAADAETALSADDPRIRDLALRARGAAIVLGFHERGEDGAAYSSMAWLEHGRVVGLHRKVYLSGGRWDEPRGFAPGSALGAFDTALGRVGLLVCNDAWHPVAPWALARDGAELLVVAAASADPLAGERLDIAGTWDDVLRGIARLLQVVVVFVNRSGDEDGLVYWGGSRVVDPWGAELGRAGRAPGLTVVDVEPGSLAAARSEYDVAADGRLDVVASVVDRLRRRG
jgi:predicted amidohydrolase